MLYYIQPTSLRIINYIFNRKIKLIGIFQNTLLLLVAFTVWFTGSLIVIQIDSTRKLEIVHIALEREQKSQIKLIDSYCQDLERKDLYTNSRGENSNHENAESEGNLLARAKREKILRDNLILIPELNQMWCLVPKAASTTWSTILLDHLNLNKNDASSKSLNYTPSQVILKQKFGHPSKFTFEKAVEDETVQKILLARHPFARIASAYEDKLKNRTARFDSQHFFQNYGAMIYRKYRKDRRIKQREPTFPEFIDHLIDTDPLDYDEHWKPISLLCGLCNVRYSSIIKTEDLPKTSRYFLNKLRIQTSAEKIHRENSIMGLSNISEYYMRISKSKMILLFRKYEMDFHIFNYSFQEYFTS